MKLQFIPIDYDYFDFQGRNYAKIIGRDEKGKRICIIDECPVYLWAILKEKISKEEIEKLTKKIQKIQLDVKGRKTRVEKVELHKKNFLSKPVQALKVFATNYKDLHDIASQIDFEEVEKRRGYDLGYTTHYIIEKKLIPLNWYEIEGELLSNSEEFGGIDMSLDVDMCVKVKEISKLKENIISEKFRPKVLAYDIETDEIALGEGEILMISLVSDNFKKVITWKGNKGTDDSIIYVKNESELIEKFIELVREISPDFLVGYFSDGFDLPYIKARAEKFNIKLALGLDESQPKFSRGVTLTGKINGIVHIDLLKFIKTAYSQYMQSETLSLNEVSKEFLGDTKKDFKFKHSSKIENHEWEKYYEYNLHDSVLTFQLFEKFWPDILEFSRVIQEPPFSVSRNGMSSNVEDYILHNLERFNEIPEKKAGYNEIGERKEREKYEGAFVFEPIPGLYENVAFFDFTSSYGSTIVTYNLSKSTFLESPSKNSYSIETGGKKVYFTKKPGFFPEMLKEIIEKRKQFKKELKENPDAIKRARSNSFKLLANAAYGYQGFFGARYYCLEAAAATAAFARKAIQDSIEKINKAGYEVIYSDSVDGKTKIIIKNGTKIYEEYIENLFEKKDYENLGKEYNSKEKIEVLTLDDKGNSVFKPINYIMRHKTDKKMFRVNFTNNWYIDVTEDHSLMGYQSSKFNSSKINKENPLNRIIEIKPEEIKTKANTIISLKRIPNENPESKDFPKEVYEFMGYFIGDGSFMRSKENQKNNKDYYLRLSLGLDKEEVFNKLITPLINQGYIKNYWWSKTRKGDLTMNGLKLIRLLSQDFRDTEGKKNIPKWLFNEKEENIASFLRGLFSADGCVMIRNKAPIIKYTSVKEDYIKEVRKLLYRVGISHSVFKENSVNKYKTEEKTFCGGTFSKNIILKNKEDFAKKVGFILERKNKLANIKTKNGQKKSIRNFEFDLQSVKEIKQIKTPEYVYDIEVEKNHKFFANYTLVHNTDSIAFLLKNTSRTQAANFLKKLNSELPGIMELEIEGFFKRGLWVTTRAGTTGAKKKYALIDEDNKIKIRGFETVRRDWCKLARVTQNKVLKLILEEGNEKKALEYTKEVVKRIKNREVKQDEILIRTQLKKSISEYKAISPHVIAAKKMKEQEIPVSEGNLIEYYIADTEGKKTKLVRDKVKLPSEKGEYEIKYYLEKQILPAVENIFQVFGINIKEIVDGKRQDDLKKWF